MTTRDGEFGPVLVVEREAETAKVMSSFLKQIGFVDVEAAASRREALRKMSARHFALILSDARTTPIADHELMSRVDATGTEIRPQLVVIDPLAGNRMPPREDGEERIARPLTAAGLKKTLAPVLKTG